MKVTVTDVLKVRHDLTENEDYIVTGDVIKLNIPFDVRKLTLPSGKLGALKAISEKVKFHLGGSLSLVAWNVLNRPIGDIDIVVDSELQLDIIESNWETEFDMNYERETAEEVEEVEPYPRIGLIQLVEVPKPEFVQARFTVAGYEFCAFLSKDEETKPVLINGTLFDVAHPRYAMEAKEKYVKKLQEKESLTEEQYERLEKHQMDLTAYSNWVESLTNG